MVFHRSSFDQRRTACGRWSVGPARRELGETLSCTMQAQLPDRPSAMSTTHRLLRQFAPAWYGTAEHLSRVGSLRTTSHLDGVFVDSQLWRRHSHPGGQTHPDPGHARGLLFTASQYLCHKPSFKGRRYPPRLGNLDRRPRKSLFVTIGGRTQGRNVTPEILVASRTHNPLALCLFWPESRNPGNTAWTHCGVCVVIGPERV